MHCPRCFRKPNEIPEYVEQAYQFEVTVEDFVRMDEPTYHALTDLFLCHDCFLDLGAPVGFELEQYFKSQSNVVLLVKKKDS